MKAICTKWGHMCEFTIDLLLDLLLSEGEAALKVSGFPDERGEQTLWNLTPNRNGLKVRSLGLLFSGWCNKIKGK